MRDRPITYQEFKQRVRRYRRSDLLREIAVLATTLERGKRGQGPRLRLPPYVSFSLAGVARTALESATEYRDPGITVDQLVDLCRAHFNINHPDTDAVRLLTRIVYEQALLQQPPKLNLGRTIALLGDHSPGVPGAVSALEWESLLGVSLDGFMRTGFTLYVGAMRNGGVLARSVISAPHLRAVFKPLTGEQTLAVVDRHFAETLEGHRSWLAHHRAEGFERPGYEKWSPNPLQAKPIVSIDDDLVIPVPHYVIERITPTGLYFIGQSSVGGRFTTALGTMFQNYVGEQLRLLKHGEVEPEISYGRADHQRSADWFMVFPEVVVIVEVKTARPTIALRVGAADGFDDARAKIGKARVQIVESARLIAEGHPRFAHIPADRPAVGLIVTLEPFYARQLFVGENVLDSPTVALDAIPAYALEQLVAQLADRPDAGLRLLNAINRSGTSIPNAPDAVEGLPPAENEIIERAWDQWATWPGEISVVDESEQATP